MNCSKSVQQTIVIKKEGSFTIQRNTKQNNIIRSANLPILSSNKIKQSTRYALLLQCYGPQINQPTVVHPFDEQNEQNVHRRE